MTNKKACILICGSREFTMEYTGISEEDDGIYTFDAVGKMLKVWHQPSLVWTALDSQNHPADNYYPDNVEVVTGGARGADGFGRWLAAAYAMSHEYPAEWDKHGRYAGFKRNLQMIDHLCRRRDEGYDCFVYAFWDGKSKGTNHTIINSVSQGLQVIIFPPIRQ